MNPLLCQRGRGACIPLTVFLINASCQALVFSAHIWCVVLSSRSPNLSSFFLALWQIYLELVLKFCRQFPYIVPESQGIAPPLLPAKTFCCVWSEERCQSPYGVSPSRLLPLSTLVNSVPFFNGISGHPSFICWSCHVETIPCRTLGLSTENRMELYW